MPGPRLPLAQRSSDLIGSIIDSSTSLLARQQHDVVRFAMGSPSDDLMPVELLDQISSRLCFATSTPERIDIGVRRLKIAVDRVIATVPASAPRSAPAGGGK